MKRYLLLSSVFLLFSCSKEEAVEESKFDGTIAWSKTFGGSQEENTGGVIGTPDGGMIVVGYSKSADGDVNKLRDLNDIWITKLDK